MLKKIKDLWKRLWTFDESEDYSDIFDDERDF